MLPKIAIITIAATSSEAFSINYLRRSLREGEKTAKETAEAVAEIYLVDIVTPEAVEETTEAVEETTEAVVETTEAVEETTEAAEETTEAIAETTEAAEGTTVTSSASGGITVFLGYILVSLF